MKSFLLLLCLLMGVANSQTQTIRWTVVRFDPLRSNLYDVEYLAGNTAIAVGENRVIRVGDPSGDFPVVTHAFFQPALRSVAVGAKGSMIVCGGDSGVVGFSLSNGVNWQFIQNKELGDIRQVAVHPVKGTVLIASSRGLFRWKNGAEYQRIGEEGASSVAFTNSDTAFVAFSDGEVHRSLDGGFRWAEYMPYTEHGAIVKMRYRGGILFLLSDYEIMYARNDGALDTTDITGARKFTRPDICVAGSNWFAVDGSAEQHFYSSNQGLSWEQSKRYVQGCHAIAATAKYVATVGEQAARAYGNSDEIVTDDFLSLGFMPHYKPIGYQYYAHIGGVSDSIFLLMSSPRMQLEILTEAGKRSDTMFIGDTVFRRDGETRVVGQSFLQAAGRAYIKADSIVHSITTLGRHTRSRTVMYTSGDLQNWDTMIAPESDQQWSSVGAADGQGNVYYVTHMGSLAVFNSVGGLPAYTQIPISHPRYVVCLNNVIVVASNSSQAVDTSVVVSSTDGGLTWSATTKLKGQCYALTKGKDDRLFAFVRIKSGPYQEYTVVQVSSDLGKTWTHGSYQDRSPYMDTLGQGLIPINYHSALRYTQDNGRTWVDEHIGDSCETHLDPVAFIGPNALAGVTNSGALVFGLARGIATFVDDPPVPRIHDSTVVTSVAIYDMLGRYLTSCDYRSATTFADARASCNESLTRSMHAHRGLLLCVARTLDGRSCAMTFVLE